MKVSELIEFLKREFPQDAPVAFTWEGVVEPIEKNNIYLSGDGVVMIGSDYRKEFEGGAWSARKEGDITSDE